jgi:serine/threonine-protein phosphatase PP1 catalytic subunit
LAFKEEGLDEVMVPAKDEFDVDAILEKLFAVTAREPGSMVDLEYDEIINIIDRVTQIIEKQPMLLRLKAPLVVGTDIHGQYFDLLRFMSDAGYPPDTNYLFLGDYVDRGK